MIFKTAFMQFVGKEYQKKELGNADPLWMQRETTMHLCMSSSDRIPDMTASITMRQVLRQQISSNSLIASNELPKTILYSPNPNDNEAIEQSLAASREQRQQVKFSREVHGGSTITKQV